MCRIIILLLMLLCRSVVVAQSYGLSPQAVDSIDTYINSAIKDEYFPGAQLVVGNSDGLIYSKSYGYLDYSKRSPVNRATLYDLASCTKVLATTFAVMTLVDEDRLSLNARVGDLLGGEDSLSYAGVRVQNLLYHNSGFRSGVGVIKALVHSSNEDTPLMVKRQSEDNPYIYDGNFFIAKYINYDEHYVSPNGCGARIASELYLTSDFTNKLDSMVYAAYNPARFGRYTYSDLNFYVLGKIVERVTSLPLSEYVASLYERMNLRDLGFNPLSWSNLSRIAPTECDMLLRRDTVRGVVHDELAFVLGGVSGSAGLFGSAESVAEMCAMFLRGGVDYGCNDIIQTSTVEQFTKAKWFEHGGVRALGFDKIDPKNRPYPIDSYGHTGFTGTYLWIDPTKDIYVVLLTNRVHPSRANRKLSGDYRADLWNMVCRGVGQI